MWLIFVPIFFSRLEGTYGIRKYHISIYSYVVSTYFDCNPQDKMAKSDVLNTKSQFVLQFHFN